MILGRFRAYHRQRHLAQIWLCGLWHVPDHPLTGHQMPTRLRILREAATFIAKA